MKVSNRVQKSLKFSEGFENLQKSSKLFQNLLKSSVYPLKVSKYKLINKNFPEARWRKFFFSFLEAFS